MREKSHSRSQSDTRKKKVMKRTIRDSDSEKNGVPEKDNQRHAPPQLSDKKQARKASMPFQKLSAGRRWHQK